MASALTDDCASFRRFRRFPEDGVPEVPARSCLTRVRALTHVCAPCTGYPPERGDIPSGILITLTARARETARREINHDR